jgi:hypothetical protein
LQLIKTFVDKHVDIRFGKDYTIRHAVANGYVDIVKYLISIGCDITANNNYGAYHAIDNNHYNMIKFLFDEANVKFDEITHNTFKKRHVPCLTWIVNNIDNIEAQIQAQRKLLDLI